MILLAVSLKDIGKSVLVKSPKNDNIREARVLFLAPVFPIKNNTNFGSQSAIFRKWFSGDRNAKAIKGNMILCGINSVSSNFLIHFKSSSIFLSVISVKQYRDNFPSSSTFVSIFSSKYKPLHKNINLLLIFLQPVWQ